MESISLFKTHVTNGGSHPNIGLSRRQRLLKRSSSSREEKVKEEDDSMLQMFGALSDDYAASVEVNGITFNVNIDTGSVAFAVAGNPDIGCDAYLNTTNLILQGVCSDDDSLIEVPYGSGWWAGVLCGVTVEFGGRHLHLTDYSAGLMVKQREMTTCTRSPPEDSTSMAFRQRPGVFMEGIAGLAFPDPLSPAFDPVLTELFSQHPEVPPLFGMQCCGYEPILRSGGDGALDLGGFDATHYEGDIQWTPVVEPRYWGVHMTAVRLEASTTTTATTAASSSKNLLPSHLSTAPALDENGHARAVVDSGTSMALFDPDTFSSILETLRLSLPDAKALPESFFSGDMCVTLDEIEVAKWPSLILELVAERNDDVDGADSPKKDPVILSIPACRYVELVPPGWCPGNAPDTPVDFPNFQPAYTFALGQMPPNQNALLGQVLFEQYYVAHDMTPGKERIGFAPLAGCASASICTNGHASPGVERQRNYQYHHPHIALVVSVSLLLVSLAVMFAVFCKKRRSSGGYTQINSASSD